MRFSMVVLCLSVLTSCVQAEPPTADSDRPLIPMPSEEALKSGIETLKSLYPSDYKGTDNKNPLQAQLAAAGLARKLLKTSEETSVDSDGYYPMLSEAIRLATFSNKPDVAFEAIDRLQKTHQVKSPDLRLQVLTHFADKGTRLNDVRAAIGFVVPAIQASADSQELGTATKLLAVGETMADRLYDRSVKVQLAQATEVIKLLIEQEDDVNEALATLETNSGSADANLTVAKFIGLRKGKWEEAEAYAVRVEENDVRSLFVRELSNPLDPEERLRLANDWWDFSETQQGAVKLQAAELAASHYSSIVGSLKGFEQKQVESRLAGVQKEHIIAVRIPVQSAVVPVAERSLPPGLIQHFTFDKDSVSTRGGDAEIADKSGVGSPGVAFTGRGGVRFVKGLRGDAVEFPKGRGDLAIRFSDRHLPEGGKPRTVAMWINAGPQPISHGVYFRYGRPEPTTAFTLITYQKDQALPLSSSIFLSQHGSDAPATMVVGRTVVIDSKWHHVAVSYDGRVASLFIDGQLEDRKSLAKTTALTGEAMIGNYFPEPALGPHGYTGLIDEFQLYDRVLTDEEIGQLAMP